MSEIIKGELKKFQKATTKAGKPYLQVEVGDIFAFWWCGHFEEKFAIAKVGDDVEMEYKPGIYNTVINLKSLGNPVENTMKTNSTLVKLVLEWMGNKEVEEDEIFDYIADRCEKGTNIDSLIQSMANAGEIFSTRPGIWRVLN